MKYQFFDHTADIAFEAYGKTKEQLFENAALATFETMVDLKTVDPKEEKTIELESDSLEQLFLDFLDELIFIKDANAMLFNEFNVRIDNNSLTATLFGEEINQKKHKLKVDVKAVTLHQFKFEKTKEGYKAFVILDI